MPDNNGITLSVLNPGGTPVVYSGDPATTLQFTLTNNIGVDIDFMATGNDASLEIFLPFCFTMQDLNAMSINLEGWTFTRNTQNVSLLLTYAGNGGHNWTNGSNLAFSLTGVATTADPQTDSVQVNFNNFQRGVPSQVQTPLSISNPPIQQNGDLTKVLEVSLDNQGMVFVSATNDPLQNTIFLNIKNISNSPLYSGANMWTGHPRITATFVYGSSTGSLAPDDQNNTGPGSGSAWNIVGGVPYASEENSWVINNPSPTSGAPHPQWVMMPASTNEGIIGTGQNANVTFSFSEIISFTPPGHTQVVLQFTGFMKDEHTPYNDAVFVIDIVKQNAPAGRGLINFFSEESIYQVNEPNTEIVIPVRWAMFNVAAVNIITSFPGINPVTVHYPNPDPVAYDSATVKLPGVTQSTAVTITLQAYNGNGGFLNSMQFTVFIQANMFVDPRDGKVYPVVKLNNRIWMAENLNYTSPTGSSTIGNEADYGRVYTWDAAQTAPAGDWRLPNKEDWMDLISNFSYEQLMIGGSTGFDALLNGMLSNGGGPSTGFGVYGFYWSSIRVQDNADYAYFSDKSKSVSYLSGGNVLDMLSVRYVKDVN